MSLFEGDHRIMSDKVRLVTFHIIDGVDKGKVFRSLPTPVTIGREDGNLIRLSDERVSRFHAKVQVDKGETILTDLESTNGTRVNGNKVQIRRLKPGDRVSIGRSLLLFGSEEEIRNRISAIASPPEKKGITQLETSLEKTWETRDFVENFDHDIDPDLALGEDVFIQGGHLFLGDKPLPPLPLSLSAGQAARLSEILEFLHRNLTLATESMVGDDEGTHIALKYSDWQKVQAVQLILAKYSKAITDPEAIES
ncbi:MAG: FHA domain-containing protein [Gemmataceae bacterium]|nr:FHA domain-containing protein [Gemmataceae bacterium]